MRFSGVGALKAASTSGVLFFNLLVMNFNDASTASVAIVAITYVFAFLTFAKLGCDGVILRLVASRQDKPGIGRREFSWILRFGGVAVLGLVLAVVLSLQGQFGQAPWVIALGSAFLFGSMNSAALRGMRKQSFALLVDPGFSIFIASIAYFVIQGDPANFFISLLGYSLLASVACITYLLRSRTEWSQSERFVFSWREAAGFWGFDASNFMIAWSSNLIVMYLVAADRVAEYSLHFRLAMMLNFALIVYNLLKSPEVALIRKDSDVMTSLRVLRSDANLLTFIAVALFVLLLGAIIALVEFGPTAVSDRYRFDVLLFAILGMGFAMNVYFGPVAMILNMRGMSGSVTAAFIISASLFLAGSAMGAYFLGVYGVAVSFVVAQIVQNYLMDGRIAARYGRGIRRKLIDG